MVAQWFKSVFAFQEGCGPLCRDVQDEVTSIQRAEALARQARKQRIYVRGARKR